MVKEHVVRWLVVGVLVLIIVGAVFFLYFGEPDVYKCSRNSDCVSVQADCCGCNHGGTANAIYVTYRNYWNDKMSRECGTIDCVAMMSTHWTCFAEPECINGKCELLE